MRLISRPKLNKTVRRSIKFFTILIACMLLVAVFASVVRANYTEQVKTRNAIAAAELAELESALEAFDTIGYPNADLPGVILPSLRLHFHSACVLEELIVSHYGEEYGLIDAEVLRYIELTLDEISTASAQGNSTDLGVENLGVYMLILRNNLDARFDADGGLLPLN